MLFRMLVISRLFSSLAVLLPTLGAYAVGIGPAGATAGKWVETDYSRLRLIAASQSVGERANVRLGLQFRLNPGWKIYWRSPGDAGYPPSVDWSGSQNLGEATIGWPVPHRFSAFGFETFGYSGEVVLPIEARLTHPGEPLALRAKVDYLACEEICIPYQAELTLDLPVGPSQPSPQGFLINRYRSMVPGDGSAAGLSLEAVALSGTAERPNFKIKAVSNIPFRNPDVLVEGPTGTSFGRPKIALDDSRRSVMFGVPIHRSPSFEGLLDGQVFTITVIDENRGIEREIIAHSLPPALEPAAAPATDSISLILLLAVLGGIILNLMPCVLPVLSIKLLSIVGHGGQRRSAVRRSFLASAAGILFLFLALAAATVFLKAAGIAVGWGIQFQQPAFLVTMALVVTLFACNMLGFFDFSLPAFTWLGHVDAGRGFWSDFLVGAFVTLLATPCSAPFVGTAVGFALAHGPAEILMIFAALGLGLALPYLLVAAAPGLATALPRPGRWMVVLRRIMGIALLATAVWLLIVLAAQAGTTIAVVAALILLALGGILWLGRGGRDDRPTRRRVMVLTLAVAVVALPWITQSPRSIEQGHPTAEGIWQPLDEAHIAELVSKGNIVFVDVTADWCITCQVNKQLVLERGLVARRLHADGLVAMRGDWTRPSQQISEYLARFGRYGVPFNAVYGPGALQGIALPELLTVENVVKAIDQATGARRPLTPVGEGLQLGFRPASSWRSVRRTRVTGWRSSAARGWSG